MHFDVCRMQWIAGGLSHKLIRKQIYHFGDNPYLLDLFYYNRVVTRYLIKSDLLPLAYLHLISSAIKFFLCLKEAIIVKLCSAKNELLNARLHRLINRKESLAKFLLLGHLQHMVADDYKLHTRFIIVKWNSHKNIRNIWSVINVRRLIFLSRPWKLPTNSSLSLQIFNFWLWFFLCKTFSLMRACKKNKKKFFKKFSVSLSIFGHYTNTSTHYKWRHLPKN